MNKQYCDIIVIGGGIAGTSLSLMLAQSNFRICIIDPICYPIESNPSDQATRPDIRVLAMNYRSIELLRRIGVWKLINHDFCVPYYRLEMWEWISSKIVLNAASFNLPELGYMIEYSRLKTALWKQCINYNSLITHSTSLPNNIIYNNGQWRLTLHDNTVIMAPIIIGADGTKSWIRKKVGIKTHHGQYNQSCLLLSVKITGIHDNIAWQELHTSGPRAFLPLYNQWASLIWYDTTTRIQELLTLSTFELTQEVRMAFPSRLGSFILYERLSYSLIRQYAHQYVKPGIALIGDAAHTIHPLFGQGANIGLRDAEILSNILISARTNHKSWTEYKILQKYQKNRRSRNLIVLLGIDIFSTIFNNRCILYTIIRNAGLKIIGSSHCLKVNVLRYILGL